MAEILLSLTIIGVVAAITLPSLTGNINERTWNTQRKALYARFSQALSLMPSLNGYGEFIEATEDTSGFDNATETFVTEGLSKVLKINNICDSEHLTDCGLPDKITPFKEGSTINLADIKTLVDFNANFGEYTPGFAKYKRVDTKSAAFETQNGESILVYYNPYCLSYTPQSSNIRHYTQQWMCANFVYDLNGNKGPNAVGKDIGFITAFYPVDPVLVAPQLVSHYIEASVGISSANARCRSYGDDSRLPNIEELTAMFYNKKLLNIPGYYYWSSTRVPSDTTKVWRQEPDGLRGGLDVVEGYDFVQCVKR